MEELRGPVVVVGAGPGGLLTARVLQQSGVEVTVLEADASVDARDAGGTLDLHADTGRIALEDAGLTDAFLALARHEGQAKTRRDHTGALLRSFAPGAEDDAALEIDRGQLRRMLHDHVEPGTVRWGGKVLRAEPVGGDRHRLHLADGSTIDTALVIGADGAWSRVRPLVTDARPRGTGVSYLECRFDDVDARHPDVAAIVGDGHMFAADGRGRAVIVQRSSGGVVRGSVMLTADDDPLAASGVDADDRGAVVAWLRRRFADWDASMLPLVTDGDGPFTMRSIDVLPAPLTWDHHGGATLIGDAAHVMAPFGGYGVNLALLDGAELARAIVTAPSVDEAIRRYEARMLPRAGRLAVEANRALARFFSLPFTAETAPDHEAAHRRYEEDAAAYRRERARSGG